MKLTVSTRPVRIEGNYVSVVFNRSHNSMPETAEVKNADQARAFINGKRRLSTVWQILKFLRG
ncbi:hypothetical protein [Kluyvera sichuanensis]|uniref:hypothetical protein n=1 Tax=Kluyvera sichuanensis TaxID=2725494 RepID=UPI0039F59EBE